MTAKERVLAALEGRAVDRCPVTVLYNELYHLDHFAELTGRPQWENERWLFESPAEHLATYRRIMQQAPFEILQPQISVSRTTREQTEFFVQDGVPCRRDKRTGECRPVSVARSGHARDYSANERQRVFDRADISSITVTRAEDIAASGRLDYAEAVIRDLGREHFILTAGLTGSLWACVAWLGQTNTLRMLAEAPDFIDELCKKLLEQEIEKIRAFCNVGGDAIYIDDAMAYSDVISVQHYERFSLPYLTQMVREIRRLGHKAILIYFGGVMDRLERIVSTGADGLSVETSMKGYTNDIDEIAERVGARIALFGNIDPIGVLEKGSDEDLDAEISRQLRAGRKARGFIVCTGSPITPGTPLTRVRRFIEMAKTRAGEIHA